MASTTRKKSYTVPCASTFRQAVENLAQQKQCNVADLARSAVLMMTPDALAAQPDPGEPDQNDRETVVIQSGISKGKPWRRKPRLQVRLAPGLAVPTIRKAFGVALKLASGDLALNMATIDHRDHAIKTQEALDRLQNVAEVLAFAPVAGGIQTREQALYVMGFPPGAIPDQKALRERFRRVAQVFHPDGQSGDHERMAQINAAMERLRKGGS